MRRVVTYALGAALSLCGLSTGAHSQSQCNVSATGLLINHFQTGQVYLPAFAPQMQQIILMQTGGTRQYPALAQLGPLQSVQVIGAQPLQYGNVCGYVLVFPATTLTVQVAWGSDGLIYGVNFGAGPQNQPQNPQPLPPSPSPNPSPIPPNNPVPKDTDEACKLYPNLC